MNDPHLLAGAYAIDALTDDERTAFEAHLDDCPDCRQELSGFTETAADLSAVAASTPPPELRRDVLAAIQTVPQEAPEPASPRHAEAPADPDRPAQPEPPQLPDRTARARRWRRVTQVALAAAVAVAVAFGGWAVGRYQESQSITASASAQQELLRAPDVQLHRHQIPDGGAVTYVVSQRQDAAMILVSGRTDPGADRVYQLWTMHTEPGQDQPQPSPDRTFDGTEREPIWLDGDVASAVALAITIEPTGGAPEDKPTTDPFAVQEL